MDEVEECGDIVLGYNPDQNDDEDGLGDACDDNWIMMLYLMQMITAL